MTALNSHFVFGTTSCFSHTGPVINLVVALLTVTPDLVVSVILHKNNEPSCNEIIKNAPEGVAERIKLYTAGEKTEWKDASSTYMTMVYKSGELYGTILAAHEPWPAPNVFIFDVTSFFYVQVKSAVEANFPHIKTPALVGYMPQHTGELLFHAGSVENGSLRWVDPALDEYDPEVRVPLDQIKVLSARDGDKLMPEEEIRLRQVKAFKAVVAESDKVIKLPGHIPFHLHERWAVDVDWTAPVEFGWFQYLSGQQAITPAAQAWATCFPSSVLEPETVEAIKSDPFIGDGGKKPFFEFGWFEAPIATGDKLGEGVAAFLDKFGEKQVVYISFGTIVEAGKGLITLLNVLNSTKTPFIYACGNQKTSLPEDVLNLLNAAEKEGHGLAPEWVHQVGVLSHKATLCFISHCGVNSIMESIMAATPIICWARRWDQISLSALLSSKNLGIELLQQRSGYSVGRSPAHTPDVVVQGTEEALITELEKALTDVKGSKGQLIREEMGKVAEEIREKRKGVWGDNVKAFGQFGRD